MLYLNEIHIKKKTPRPIKMIIKSKRLMNNISVISLLLVLSPVSGLNQGWEGQGSEGVQLEKLWVVRLKI